MVEGMLGRSRAAAAAMVLRNVEFRQGVIEDLPIEDGSADVVISNGSSFGGAGGESKARLFEVFGYAFLAQKPK